MRVKVQYLGMLKELAGRESAMVEVTDGETLGQLFAQLRQQAPSIGEFQRAIALAVNYEYSSLDRVLHEGDEVALIPPVSGGAPDIQPTSEITDDFKHAALVRDHIDAAAIGGAIRQPADGAVVAFDGVVRNETRGRRTLYLEYSAYEPMALRQMEHLAVQALASFAVRDVWVVHRLGRLEIGETSVYIAVAAAHRTAAFDACRWVIDTLKKTVPLWKKEFFEDGAVWADGEPFPAEVPLAGGASK